MTQGAGPRMGARAYQVDGAWLSREELETLWRENAKTRTYSVGPHREVRSQENALFLPLSGIEIRTLKELKEASRKRRFRATRGRPVLPGRRRDAAGSALPDRGAGGTMSADTLEIGWWLIPSRPEMLWDAQVVSVTPFKPVLLPCVWTHLARVRTRSPSKQWRTRAEWDGRLVQAHQIWALRYADGNWFLMDGDPDSTTDSPVDLKLWLMPPEWGIQPGHSLDLFTITANGTQLEPQHGEHA